MEQLKQEVEEKEASLTEMMEKLSISNEKLALLQENNGQYTNLYCVAKEVRPTQLVLYLMMPNLRLSCGN